MHKFTKKDPTSQISNIRRQSPTEDILHQYFISSYFRTSLGFPQLRKKFRRQEKLKTFSSPTPLTYAVSDSNATSRDTSLVNAKLTGGNNSQNGFVKNTFSPSISPDNVQENKEEPPNNVKGFYFIRRSETNNLALQTPIANCRNNTAYHISEVMYYNRSGCRDSNDLRKKDSKSFGVDSHSKRSQPPGPVPTIVVQRASVADSLHSLSYNLSTPNTAHNGENDDVIENKVMNAYSILNAYGDAQNLQSENSEVQHSTTDSSHANKEGESSTASNFIPNTSVMDRPYPAYPILDNRQTSDKPSFIDYSMHDQAAPNIDEAKYTFLSSLLNDTGSNDLAVTKPYSNSNTQPANTHLDNQLVNKPFYALTPNEQKYSNGPYDAQYSYTGDSVTQRDNSNILEESAGEFITPEDTEDIATTNAAFDNDDDDNYNDNGASTSAAPIIQYQLTTYSVTSVSRNDVTDKNANNASANANETKNINISRDDDKNNAHLRSSLSNTQRRESSKQNDETHPKPPPPPMSLNNILIATGQIDVANQALAVRRANAFPEPESPKSPTRKFGLNKIRKIPKISKPVLVSSTSNIKTVPIVHLNPDENPKVSNKLQIDAAGITKSIKKFKEAFAQDEPKRALNISEPEVLMTPSLCKYFSEETLRRRFHIDTSLPINGMKPASTETEHGKPRLLSKQLPDLPQTYNDRIAQSKNSGEPLYDINTIKYHAEGVKKFVSVPQKETTAWNLSSSENTDPIEEEAGRAYALRAPPTTPVSPSFTIANASTFGRAIPQNQQAFIERDEKDGAPHRKPESTVASKIFSALNNFAERNATSKYEPDLSDRADSHVRDKRGHGANASKDSKRRKRSFIKNTIIVTKRPDDTQASLRTPKLDSSDGSADNRATIGSQGRKWLLAQCVTQNVPTTDSTDQLTRNIEEDASNYRDPDSLYDQRLRSSSESLYDLYQYIEEKRDSAEISSASLQDQDKNKGQYGEANDIWRVVNGLRLSSRVSQGDHNGYRRDAESDAYYKAKRNEDAASFYRNDSSESHRSTFTPPPLRPVVKPHSPASNTTSSDYFLPELGTIYGSAAARI